MPNARPALFPLFVTSLLATTAITQGPAELFTIEHPRSAFDWMVTLSAAPAIADFNGDGVLDAAFAGPEIQWGTGTGFEYGTVLAAGSLGGRGFDSAPIAFDCDQDGDEDLLQPPGNLWLNDGAGNFAASSGPTLAFEQKYAAIDIDGDGDLDVISNAGRILVNDGLGGLTDETTTRVVGAPSFILPDPLDIADFDGDGDADAVYAGGILSNDGQGVFTVTTNLVQTLRFAVDAFAVDPDSDGDMDIVTSTALLLRNDGTGAFVSESFAYAGVRAVGDVNGDGHDDLVVMADSYPYDKGWVAGDGIGFGLLQPIGFPGTSTDDDPFWWRVGLADLDGDGDLDVTAQIHSITRLLPPLAVLNDGGGGFELAAQLSGASFTVSRSREIFDVDGDGSLDIVTSDRVYINDGSGQFALNSQLPGGSLPWVFHGHGDWDGDGDQDLAVAQPLNAPVSILANDGSGGFSFGAFATVSVAGGAAVATIDWDGDGDEDLLALRASVVWWENTGGGTLVPNTLMTVPTNSTGADIDAADIDGDGRPDLALSLSSPAVPGLYDVAPLFQEANGSLTLVNSITVNRGYSVEIHDLNGDGLLDLAATGLSGQSKAFVNLGNRAFADSGWVLPSGISGLGDVDLDGRVDLVRAQQWPVVHRNVAPGQFVDIGPFDVFGVPPRTGSALDLADLDGDGDLDMIHSGTGPGSSNPQGLFFYWNIRRHVRLDAVSTVGGRLRVGTQSSLGSTSPGLWALPWVGFRRASLVVPSVGVVGIDLSDAIGLPWAPFVGADAVDTSVAIPLMPSLVGTDVFVQSALVGTPSGVVELTNVASSRIGG